MISEKGIKEAEISFDAGEPGGFAEWKRMWIRGYVLGLECENCCPDGSNAIWKKGILQSIHPGTGRIMKNDGKAVYFMIHSAKRSVHLIVRTSCDRN